MKTGRKSWFGQRASDVKSKGKNAAPWVVFWNDPNTGKRKEKSCGPGKDGWRLAKCEADRMHAAIVSGVYESADKPAIWKAFRADFERDVLPNLAPQSRRLIRDSFDHFERIANPGRLKGITSKTIAEYIGVRRGEAGKKAGDRVSPATINKELRNLKAAFRKAVKWKLMPACPDIEFVPEIEQEPIYMIPEHFDAIYAACPAATKPVGVPYPPSDWWQALLVTLYMTGWRITETLELKREDLDLETGVAKLQSHTTKARRFNAVRLHPLVIEHLKRINGFDEKVFPWPHDRRTLDIQFHKLQRAAGIKLACHDEHEHTDACHAYGFHAGRKAFATMNAANLTADALQRLMRHKSYLTTQRYINMSRQLDTALDVLHVPAILTKTTSA